MNVNDPDVGDYVICSYKNSNMTGYSKIEQNFIQNKIGKIIRHSSNTIYPYCVSYDDIPTSICNNGDEEKEDYIILSRSVIEYWSKDKGKLELILITNKFNI